ncbi:MAG: Sir2 family NAD-dependent protein deacetylase, partial [bacterium]
MSTNDDEKLNEALGLAAQWLREARSVVGFTGAGVSTESGIPDFRSPGGIWEKYDPEEMTYQRFLASEEARKLRWKLFLEMEASMNAGPNPSHYALVELYELGKLTGVITQNIDGLHQAAGLPDEAVIEIHGNAKEVYCLSCSRRWPSREIKERIENEGVEVPYCTECGGILKLATVSFG